MYPYVFLETVWNLLDFSDIEFQCGLRPDIYVPLALLLLNIKINSNNMMICGTYW